MVRIWCGLRTSTVQCSSMYTVVSIFIAIISMIAIGLIVWRVVTRREQIDPKFQAKLDADDERARKGREGRGA